MNALTDFLQNLSPKFFFEDPQKMRSSLYWVFLAIFLASLIGGIVMSVGSQRFSQGNRLHRALYQRYGAWLGWLGGLGILILIIRYADVVLFSKRIWTVLDLFAILAVGIHYAWYRMKQYPEQLEFYREEERRSRYLPPAQRGRTVMRAVRRRR
jgi:hypothetical protein